VLRAPSAGQAGIMGRWATWAAPATRTRWRTRSRSCTPSTATSSSPPGTPAAAALRKAGDKTAAAAVKKLGRPTVAAWAINQLVRANPDLTQDLAALGVRLRDAQATLDAAELKALRPDRDELLERAVHAAGTVAAARGQALGAAADEVRGTFVAALADPRRRGRGDVGAVGAGVVVRRVRRGRTRRCGGRAPRRRSPRPGAPPPRTPTPGQAEASKRSSRTRPAGRTRPTRSRGAIPGPNQLRKAERKAQQLPDQADQADQAARERAEAREREAERDRAATRRRRRRSRPCATPSARSLRPSSPRSTPATRARPRGDVPRRSAPSSPPRNATSAPRPTRRTPPRRRPARPARASPRRPTTWQAATAARAALPD
jgi:hypothetical protein